MLKKKAKESDRMINFMDKIFDGFTMSTNTVRMQNPNQPAQNTNVQPAQQMQQTQQRSNYNYVPQPNFNYSAKRYPPFSAEATHLFAEAMKWMALNGYPDFKYATMSNEEIEKLQEPEKSKAAAFKQSWSPDNKALHTVLQKESNGWVGIPNYTYGERAKNHAYWPSVHEEVKKHIRKTISNATGLGQLLGDNIDKYYPSGRNGIGIPKEEAVGFIRYIYERSNYKTPQKALDFHIKNKWYSDKNSPNITKVANTSIVIEPFEPLIKKAIELLNNKIPGYLNNIKKIIVVPGSPDFYGKVESDKTDVIFISLQKIIGAMSGRTDDEKVIAIAQVIGHEKKHLDMKFQGGEGPSEQEEKEVLKRIASYNTLAEQMRGWHYYFTENHEVHIAIAIADVLNSKIIKEAKKDKVIMPKDNPILQNPTELAKTILRIIYHFSAKVKYENRPRYLASMKRKLAEIDPYIQSTKNKNPGSGIGAVSALLKNLLIGQSAQFCSEVLKQVQLKGVGL